MDFIPLYCDAALWGGGCCGSHPSLRTCRRIIASLLFGRRSSSQTQRRWDQIFFSVSAHFSGSSPTLRFLMNKHTHTQLFTQRWLAHEPRYWAVWSSAIWSDHLLGSVTRWKYNNDFYPYHHGDTRDERNLWCRRGEASCQCEQSAAAETAEAATCARSTAAYYYGNEEQMYVSGRGARMRMDLQSLWVEVHHQEVVLPPLIGTSHNDIYKPVLPLNHPLQHKPITGLWGIYGSSGNCSISQWSSSLIITAA